MSDENDILHDNGIDLPDISELADTSDFDEQAESLSADSQPDASSGNGSVDITAEFQSPEDASSESIDQSVFTGQKEEVKNEEENISSMLQEHFSPKQIGSIAHYTEPVSGSFPLESIAEMFKSDDKLEVVPVEEFDHVVGFIDRKKISSITGSVWKRITANNVIDYTQRIDVILYARDYIEKTLKKVSDINRKFDIRYFPVFNGKSFFGMVSLDDFLDRIAEIREQDLAKASVIQQSFFPHDDIISSLPYSFHFWNKMANELGGDIIEVYKFSQSRSLIGCFDVSGKNVAASLLTITVGAFFNSLIAANNGEKNPVRVIAMLDSYLAKVVPSGNFITAMFCYVDEETKKICLFNCGHTTSYLIKKDGASGALKVLAIDPKLPPLGMGVVAEQLRASLTEKDVSKRPYVAYNMVHGLHLDMYSDGFTDMKDEAGHRYEDDNAKKFFTTLYELNDDEVEACIEKTVSDWTGEAMLPDDVTVMDIRF